MNKYRNVHTIVDGIRFDSKREAARWQELKLLERAGEIELLERQVKYPLVVSGLKVGTYICDAAYFDKRTGEHVVEDTKGVLTPTYRLKKKLVKALYGVEIREVK